MINKQTRRSIYSGAFNLRLVRHFTEPRGKTPREPRHRIGLHSVDTSRVCAVSWQPSLRLLHGPCASLDREWRSGLGSSKDDSGLDRCLRLADRAEC